MSRTIHRSPRWAAVALLGALPMPLLAQVPQLPTEPMPLASVNALILDITESDQRAVAVGERGHVLVSESRSDWRQIEGVPTRATLTAVTAVADKVWAVGHDGIILHSADGGLTWAMQRVDAWTPPAEDDLDRDPTVGAPLLDVLFVDANNGFAVGAYSLMLRTRDGGTTWERVTLSGTGEAAEAADAAADAAEADADSDEWMFSDDELALEEETDPHLNGIVSTGSLMFVVAERGSAFRSRDGGETWERLTLPYDGSMFGALALGDQHLLAYGLRGNVLESNDGGGSWRHVDTGTTLTLLGGASVGEGGAVIVGANGVVLYRAEADAPLTLGTFENTAMETPVLAAVHSQGSRTFLVVGEKGFGRYEVR